jgi:hypothetical protein
VSSKVYFVVNFPLAVPTLVCGKRKEKKKRKTHAHTVHTHTFSLKDYYNFLIHKGQKEERMSGYQNKVCVFLVAVSTRNKYSDMLMLSCAEEKAGLSTLSTATAAAVSSHHQR